MNNGSNQPGEGERQKTITVKEKERQELENVREKRRERRSSVVFTEHTKVLPCLLGNTPA
jgi:hypothetical protein